MADDPAIPPWVNFVLEQVNRQFEGVNKRLDNLVTQESFRQEQARVNERLEGHDRELGEVKGQISAEATARNTENQIRLKEENAQKDKLLATQRQTQWQWFLIFAGPLVTWILTNFFRAGG